jgi:hypothetical protein
LSIDGKLGPKFKLVFDHATEEQKAILENEFDVAPFSIETIKLERIFIDKIFAAEFYYRRGQYFDTAKHIYDLIILFDHQNIKELLTNSISLREIILYKRREEKIRSGGISDQLPICNFTYLKEALDNQQLKSEYQKMQRIYIFNERDSRPLIKAKAVFAAIARIKE